MNRIFGKLYTVKWLKLLKASTKCQPKVNNFKLFSNCNCPRGFDLPLLSDTPVKLLSHRARFDCTNKRFCRKLAKDKKFIKLEVGANKARSNEKIDRILSTSDSVKYNPQITWKAKLKKNDVKAKRKSKLEVSGGTKKTQSEFNMRDAGKSGFKTRTSTQTNSSVSKTMEKPPITLSSYGSPPVQNNSVVSKIPKIVNPVKQSVKVNNFANDGHPKVVRCEENKVPTACVPEKAVVKLPEKVASPPKTESLPSTVIQDDLKHVKFTFVADNRDDIPPPKEINLLNQFQTQVANAPVPIDNKSNLSEFINRPKVNIKSLKPFKSLETVAKTFKLNPLVKQEEEEAEKVNLGQNQLFDQLKVKHQALANQSSPNPETPIKTSVKVQVPTISATARAMMRKTQIFNTRDVAVKPVTNVPHNPSVTILNKAKFPDRTPVIPPPPPDQEKKLPNPMLAKSSTFILDSKPSPPPDHPKVVVQLIEAPIREPPQPQKIERNFEHGEEQQKLRCAPPSQDSLTQATKGSKSKLPRPFGKMNVDNDENELHFTNINKKLADELISEKCSLPHVIEPAHCEPTFTKDSSWKLINGSKFSDVLEHIKPLKKKLSSKIPVRNINEHPLLLESGDKGDQERGDSASDYSKPKIVE